MTILSLLKSVYCPVLAVPAALALILQLYLVIASVRFRRGIPRTVAYSVHFGISLVLFYLLLLIWYTYTDNPKEIPDFAWRFGALSFIPLLVYEALTLIIVSVELWELRRFRENHLDSLAIKEAMDLLPVGIAFAREDGMVVFANLLMNELAWKKTGGPLTNLQAIREETPVPGEPAQWEWQLENKIWQVSQEAVMVDGRPCLQLIAADITGQAAINRELRDKNGKLKDLNLRLTVYNRQADRMIIAQEMLNARMQVHREAGHVLLMSRHYLEHPGDIDPRSLLNSLKNINTYLLREYEQDDTARDPLPEAISMAEAIGVEVEIEGAFPEDPVQRSILSAAIGECASNTVKHADGDRLRVAIRDQDQVLTIRLSNNGAPPEREVSGQGGLLSLQKQVENAGGRMEIVSRPAFLLTIRLPAPDTRPSSDLTNESKSNPE
ncbi:MAG: hypothetical protein J5949_03695 [Oscillospiraceae bacterium]|nr:hypothetical protein [Oscillospiraceae bacterium]